MPGAGKMQEGSGRSQMTWRVLPDHQQFQVPQHLTKN